MNSFQKIWWQQAKSDHDVFVLLRGQGVAQCHSLHYLQMATEKIAKAYFWRDSKPLRKNHAGFVQFLRFLGQIKRANDQKRVASIFSYNRYKGFQHAILKTSTIAYELQNLAPSLAGNGPNPEYP